MRRKKNKKSGKKRRRDKHSWDDHDAKRDPSKDDNYRQTTQAHACPSRQSATQRVLVKLHSVQQSGRMSWHRSLRPDHMYARQSQSQRKNKDIFQATKAKQYAEFNLMLEANKFLGRRKKKRRTLCETNSASSFGTACRCSCGTSGLYPRLLCGQEGPGKISGECS